VQFILKSYSGIFRENYVFYAILCTPFPILHSGIGLFCISQVFGPFYTTLPLNDCNWTLHGHPQVTMPMEGRKSRRMSKQSLLRTVRCGLISPRVICFLALSSSFNSIISCDCSTSRQFRYKKVVFNLIPHHIGPSWYSILFFLN